MACALLPGAARVASASLRAQPGDATLLLGAADFTGGGGGKQSVRLVYDGEFPLVAVVLYADWGSQAAQIMPIYRQAAALARKRAGERASERRSTGALRCRQGRI